MKGQVKVYDQASINLQLKGDRNGPKRWEVPLDECYFDVNRVYGQPRKLKNDLYNKYYLEMFNTHPPAVPYAEALGWQKSGMHIPPFSPHPIPPFIAHQYIILGGQHFIKALQLLKEYKLKNEQGCTEDTLPPSLKVVQMLVLLQGTEYGMRAYLAGKHQKRQSAAEACSLSDFFNLVVDEAKKKQAIAIQKRNNAYARCEFEGDEIWTLLECSGMKVEENIERIESLELTKTKAAEMIKNKV